MLFGEGVGHKSERTRKLIETALQEHRSISNKKPKKVSFCNAKSEVLHGIPEIQQKMKRQVCHYSSCDRFSR